MSDASFRASGLTPVFAPAKINLFLHVTGRRDDGLHALQSLFVFASVGDYLDAATSTGLSLDITGPFAAELTMLGAGSEHGSNNIVLRAAEALQALAGRSLAPLCVRLQKNLPVAAGVGGGSADAAAALRLLSAHWDLKSTEDELMALALRLGADVPACLDGRASWVEGIGEKINPLPEFSPFACVLVNPMVEVSTPEVFKRFAAGGHSFSPPTVRWQGGEWHELLDFLKDTRNDLQKVAVDMAPEIVDVLNALGAEEKCELARMSGSGATCFGLFADGADADRAAASIKSDNPEWWVVVATLGNAPHLAA